MKACKRLRIYLDTSVLLRFTFQRLGGHQRNPAAVAGLASEIDSRTG